jgi:hypothetical protein
MLPRKASAVLARVAVIVFSLRVHLLRGKGNDKNKTTQGGFFYGLSIIG